MGKSTVRKGAKGGSVKKEKTFKMGKKVFKDKKTGFLKKQLKKEVAKREERKHKQRGDEDKITIAWKGKEKKVNKQELTKDKKGRDLLQKIEQKRVLSADEKHRLKMLGDTGDLMKLWETLREKARPKEEKKKAMKQILAFTKDTFADDVRKPDLSRIFQSLLKWGDAEVREEVFNRVEGQIVELCSSSHANQFVRSMVEYATGETKDRIFAEVCTAGGKILSQKNALVALEHVYNKANAERQNLLLVSFFDGIEVKTMKGYPKLEDIFANMPPQKLEYKMLLERLLKIVNPSIVKGSFDNIIVHRLLEVLLRYGTDFEVTDILDEVVKAVVNICKTKHGAAAALLVAQHAPNGMRKPMIRSFQHSVVDMCLAKSTTFFIARLFDICDDTTYVSKTIVKEMVDGMDDLVVDPVGSIPLIHLLTPDPEHKKKYITFSHFDELWNESKQHPNTIECLSAQYQTQTKEIFEVPPQKKHEAALRLLVPAMVESLMKSPKDAVENFVSRRIVTELLHYASTHKGTPINNTAVTALKAALEGRIAEKESKRKASDSPSDAPSAKKARTSSAPAKGKAKAKAKAADSEDDAPMAASARPAAVKKAAKKVLKKKQKA